MTQREAIIQSLRDIKGLATYSQVTKHIIKNKYFSFEGVKKPTSSISKSLGTFIRNGDSRVKRVKNKGAGYSYYLSIYEKEVATNSLKQTESKSKVVSSKNSFNERSLHKLLSTFLKNTDIYCKTVFHEQSKASKDNHQKWIHPDMVGISFVDLNSKASNSLLKALNRADVFKLTSYELKKEINNDYELKKSFFQAVSNSSWANYGYLVAFEISSSLSDEIERLNQSFGIGVIELKSNPFESKILYVSTYRELDYKTLDKLCNINPEFELFIEQAEKLLTADDRYVKATEKELDEFCDSYLTSDTSIEKYCKDNNIPLDLIEDDETSADNTGS